MSEWQPIASAPKDGSVVGLVNAAGVRGLGAWAVDRWVSVQTDEAYEGYGSRGNLGPRIVGWCAFELPPFIAPPVEQDGQ